MPTQNNWYVLMSKPGKSTGVYNRLVQAGYEVFNPMFRQYNSKQSKYFTKQLFPSYLFAKLDIEKDFRIIKYTRGINKIIGTGSLPSPVPVAFVEFLMSKTDSDGIIHAATEDGAVLKCGDRVLVTNGPLQGAEAIVSGSFNDKQRIEILMNLIKVKVSKSHVRKID